MKSYYVEPCISALTVDGDATGIITVADGSKFFVGAFVTLADNAGLAKSYWICKKVSNAIHLMEVEKISYTRADLSLFLVANSATLYQDRQVVCHEFIDNFNP